MGKRRLFFCVFLAPIVAAASMMLAAEPESATNRVPEPTAVTQPPPTQPAPSETEAPVPPETGRPLRPETVLEDELQPPAPIIDAPLVRPFTDVAAGAALSEIAFGDTYVPNMMGDLLGGTSSITYLIGRTGPLPGDPMGFVRPTDVDAFGTVGFRNAKVAENNSPRPRDRFGFRYNHFHNAADVTGYTTEDPTPVAQLPGTIPPVYWFPLVDLGILYPIDLSPIAGQPFPDLVQLRTVSRDFHVDLFTFSVEKTFADGLASIELRVPFANSVGSNLDLTTGRGTDTGFGVFDVTPTPWGTLGNDETQWGNMSIILKGILQQSRSSVISGGLAIGLPTAGDSSVNITDYFSLLLDFTADEVGRPDVPGPRFLDFGLQAVRSRSIKIDNETVALSPFLAAVHAPNERLFYQGFLQVEVPVNQNTINYSRSFRFAENSLAGFAFPSLEDEYRATGKLQEQTLLHLDIGAGCWLYRNPQSRFVRGLAGLVELHYTNTLNDADTVVLPGAFGAVRPVESVHKQMLVAQDQETIIGNTANRLDILNLTTGSTVLLGRHASLATAFVFPLRDGHDKLFDWEFNLQVNLFR